MSQIVIVSMINFWSSAYGIDANLAKAVAMHESSMNINAVGKLNEQGLYQLRPEFYKEYSEEQLKDPDTNIRLGIKYLAEMKQTCVHKNSNDWLVCYNMGATKAKKVKHPDLFPYVLEVNKLIIANR